MSQFIRKKDGSITVKGADGKIAKNIPAASKAPKAAPAMPTKAEATNDSIARVNASYEEMRARQNKIAEQRETTRSIMANFTDEIEEKFPRAFYMGVDDDLRPISLEDADGNVVEILDSARYESLREAFSENHDAIANSLDSWHFRDRTPHASGASKAIHLSFRCKESSDCTFRTSRYGFAPRHEASQYCGSGRRAHCTCDVCF